MTPAATPVETSEADSNVNITFEDQQKINECARLDALAKKYKDELMAKMRRIDIIRNYFGELSFIDEDDNPNLPYLPGETLSNHNIKTIENYLEELKKTVLKDALDIVAKLKDTMFKSSVLKQYMCDKYGKNITWKAKDSDN